MSRDRLSMGIIGAGRIGKVHAANLAFRLPETSVLAITDVDRRAAEEVAKRCRIPQVAPGHAEIFSNP